MDFQFTFIGIFYRMGEGLSNFFGRLKQDCRILGFSGLEEGKVGSVEDRTVTCLNRGWDGGRGK